MEPSNHKFQNKIVNSYLTILKYTTGNITKHKSNLRVMEPAFHEKRPLFLFKTDILFNHANC